MPTSLRMAPRETCALLAALVALGGLPHISGNSWNLACFKSCCFASCRINCSWEMPAGTNETTSILNIWYHDAAEEHHPFEAGRTTSILLDPNKVYSLQNATVGVESCCAQDGHPFQSENRTFCFSQAIKFQRVDATSIAVSRSKGLITLAWPESHECYDVRREKEARMKPPAMPNWAQGNCTPGKDDSAKKRVAAVACQVRENIPYEVQVRYRVSHWSSYWSDWSPSVVVPAEIFRSPEINFTVGRLGGDGLRNVTVEWERPSPDQEMVKYFLKFDLPCRNCLSRMETLLKTVYNQTSYQVALSGAAYNVSLQAANKAGEAPVSFVWLPPEQESGPRILNVSLSGQNFKAWWKAPVDAGMFCFESQVLGDFPLETPCNNTGLKTGKVYEYSGVVKPNQCYHLAIHGLSQATSVWSTLGFTHLFQQNASLEDPINVNVTKQTPNSATVQWEPPSALSSCPGVLKKFVICCQKDEESAQTTYYDASASEREFTIPELQPQTAYLVGVWPSTDQSGKDCEAHLLFLTSPADAKMTALTLSFLALGIFVAFLTAAGGFHFCRKRIQEALWPPLPGPDGTEAMKILSAVTPGQVRGWRRFMEPLESGSTMEPFLVEKGEDGLAMKDTEDSQGLIPAVEELKPPTEEPLSSGDPLPSEYKAQGLLNPMEQEP